MTLSLAEEFVDLIAKQAPELFARIGHLEERVALFGRTGTPEFSRGMSEPERLRYFHADRLATQGGEFCKLDPAGQRARLEDIERAVRKDSRL